MGTVDSESSDSVCEPQRAKADFPGLSPVAVATRIEHRTSAAAVSQLCET